MTDPTPDLHHGKRALHLLHHMAELDDPHTLWHDDGFTWWSGEVPVRFRWRAPGADDPLPVWRITAEVDVARGLDQDTPQADAFLILLSTRFNQFSSVVEGGTLTFRALVPTWPGGGAAALAQLIYRAGFMVRTAERVVPAVVGAPASRTVFGLGGCKLLRSVHPEAGRRSESATQLDGFVEAAVHHGAEAAELGRRPDLGAAMTALRLAGCDKVAGPDERKGLVDVASFNVVLETRHATSLLELQRDVPNPDVGLGLLVVLRVRFPSGHLHGSPQHLARELNRAEWTTGAPLQLLGSWTTVAAGSDVAYSAFYPNLEHHLALAREATLDGLRRVRWVFDHFGYTEPFSRAGPYTDLLLGRAGAARAEA